MEDDAVKQQKPGPNRWGKGTSGNAGGRPKKGHSLAELLAVEMDKICQEDKEKRTWKQLFILANLRWALKGHSGAMKEIWERTDGKVPQPLTGDQAGGPITIKVVYADDHITD